MQQPLQPLFQKGDKVLYVCHDELGNTQSEVCTIESIILGDHNVFYELAEISKVVMEKELISYEESKEFQEEEVEESISFVQNYTYDDLVYVDGYEQEVYIVKGVIIEIYRYKNEEWTEVSYELEKDGMCIYAYDEDLTLVSDTVDMKRTEDSYFRKATSSKKTIQSRTDSLLDDYNDYMTLYNLFGDKEYRELAKAVLEALKHMQS